MRSVAYVIEHTTSAHSPSNERNLCTSQQCLLQWLPEVTGETSTLWITTANPVEADNDETEGPKLLCLPYVQGVSEKIERGCRKLGVQAVFKSGNKLRQSLMRVKTAIEEDSIKERCHLRGTLWWVQPSVHWRNRKEPEGEDAKTSVCYEEEGYEERDCCTRLWTPTHSGLEWSKSKMFRTTSLEEESLGGHTYTTAAQHMQPRLWTTAKSSLAPSYWEALNHSCRSCTSFLSLCLSHHLFIYYSIPRYHFSMPGHLFSVLCHAFGVD